jgi:septum formation protein
MPTDGNSNAPANPPPRIVLASTSPRRASLMRARGIDVEVVEPPYDESTFDQTDLAPRDRAVAISRCKAESARHALIGERAWVLAGDTIAALGDRILGKPVDRADARSILDALTGTVHEVITGVALLNVGTGAWATGHAITTVTMRSMSQAEIERYLDTDAWRGKAGAYGIQDHGDRFVERIEGSFTNVVGFPMELIERMLTDWAYPLPRRPT